MRLTPEASTPAATSTSFVAENRPLTTVCPSVSHCSSPPVPKARIVPSTVASPVTLTDSTLPVDDGGLPTAGVGSWAVPGNSTAVPSVSTALRPLAKKSPPTANTTPPTARMLPPRSAGNPDVSSPIPPSVRSPVVWMSTVPDATHSMPPEAVRRAPPRIEPATSKSCASINNAAVPDGVINTPPEFTDTRPSDWMLKCGAETTAANCRGCPSSPIPAFAKSIDSVARNRRRWAAPVTSNSCS